MNVRFDVNQMRAAKCAQVPQIHRYERLIIPRACRLWQIAERFNYTRVVTAVNAFVVNSFAKRITRPVEIHQIYAKFINYLRDRDQTNISNEQLSKWTFAWTVLIVSIASFEETRIGLGSIKKHETKKARAQNSPTWERGDWEVTFPRTANPFRFLQSSLSKRCLNESRPGDLPYLYREKGGGGGVIKFAKFNEPTPSHRDDSTRFGCQKSLEDRAFRFSSTYVRTCTGWEKKS